MVIYERHVVPRAERRIFEMEQDNKALREEIEHLRGAIIGLQRTIEILRKQIQDQEEVNSALVQANQYLEYHVPDYF
jgi:predicted  nucleic acid-binding Zn-ribbon protein